MSYTVETITLDEYPHFRARIVTDEYPDAPYDDGSSPIVRVAYSRRHDGWEAEQVDSGTSHRIDSGIEDAAAKWGDDVDKFERYLRIFHGTTAIKWFDSGDFSCVTFDTAVWREEMGLTEAHLAAHPEVRDGLANMDEYRAYIEGDVYGIVIEKLVQWVKLAGDQPIFQNDDGSDGIREEWEDVDSFFGFYGDVDGYVTETAREMLKDAAEVTA